MRKKRLETWQELPENIIIFTQRFINFPFDVGSILMPFRSHLTPCWLHFDIILSPAVGGIVIGYELGRLLNKETIFSERVEGNFTLRRDFALKKNQRVLIVEDVITTGKSSLECSKIVSANGATLVGYACIIDRSNGRSSLNEKIISQIQLNIPTYTKENLPKNLSLIKPVKPGSRNL